MLRDDAVAMIKNRLGNVNDTTLDALIVTEMQLAQSMLEQEAELPWFLWRNTSQASTTQSVLAPAGFLNYTELAPLMVYTGSKYIECIKEDVAVLEAYEFDSLGTYPTHYHVMPLAAGVNYETIKVFGWDGVTEFTLQWNGYYADPELTTNVENRWLKYAPDLLIAKTGEIIAGNYMAYAQFKVLFQEQRLMAQQRLANKNALWEEQQITRIMGGG